MVDERGGVLLSEKMEMVKQEYSQEISSIENRLRYLEQGLITELKGANMYGSLSTNIQKLRKELNDFFSKVVNEKDSLNDDLSVLFNIDSEKG